MSTTTNVNKVVFKTKGSRNVALKSFALYPRDNEMIDDLAGFLGCSRSEAVRTAVRSFVAQTMPAS